MLYTWSRSVGRSFAAFSLAAAMLLGCSTETTPEEDSFHRRAAQIGVKHRTEDVKRQLGEPTRVVEGLGTCDHRGGDKAWVYESFETPAGRVKLKGGSVIVCVTNQGAVVSTFDVVR